MKILHITYADNGGGAAIAAYRHHEAMLCHGIDSKMLVAEKRTKDKTVIPINNPSVSIFLAKVVNKLLMKFYKPFAVWSYNHFGYDLSNNPEVKKADIIILHWINRYTISIKSLEKILNTGKPVFWFMHDVWPITGGCHHPFECDFYKTHCRKCPMLNDRRGSKMEKDLSYRQFEEKIKRLKPYTNLHFLTPSNWLAKKVKESALFGDNTVDVMRNVVDTSVFKPRDKNNARERLGLPLDKKLILFGADNISSPYKGWLLLKEALSEPINNVEAVMYGFTSLNLQDNICIKLHTLGHIKDQNILIDLYSACDLFITTSIAENYPNVIIEAMACGLPCIGTNVGGIPEIITSECGSIVDVENHNNIRASIIKIIKMADDNYNKISNLARKQICDINSYEKLSNIYLTRINEFKNNFKTFRD